MLKNYFKTAWRNITRSIGYSALNVLGLAIGMAVALLIGLWVYNQYCYDKYIPEYQSVYRVQRNFNSNGDTLTFQTTSLKLADALRRQISEIEYVAECDWISEHGLMVGDKKLYLPGAMAGTDFLKILQYPFKQGNANTAFKDAYSIVLTQSTAKALFGDEDAMNKTVRIDNQNNLKVTGILKDIPGNVTVDFNYVVPSSYSYQINPTRRTEGLSSFGNNNLQIFVKLKAESSISQVAQKIRNIEHTEKGNINAMNSYVILQPANRWHLYSNYVNGQDRAGFLEYVRMFTIIGLLVLIIACINFVNLTTARSEKRAKEVGVRKVTGARRKDLILQFLSEAFLLTTIAFVFSVLFARLALPAFNALTGDHILIPFSSGYFWLLMIGSLLAISLLAGSRPAFYLSSFSLVKVLKGALQVGKSSFSRKVLVVIQFSCSIALIISSIVIYQQIQHAKNRPKGYSLDRLIQTTMNDELIKNYTAIKNDLIEKRIVSSVGSASSPATDIWWHTDIDHWPGKKIHETVEMGCMYVSQGYFKTIGMKLQNGRYFTNGNDTTSVILNEAAIRRLGLKNPLNQKITWGGKQYTISGIVKDAFMLSPFKSADPTMFYSSITPQDVMLYRLSPNINTQDAIKKLTAVFTKYNSAYPYSYSFTDENYASKFKLEMLIGKLAALFAILAIFISCLGLFGLASYVAEQRTKEIGIRKILGATVKQVWILLSKDFIILVLISCLVAGPVSYYFLHKWLLSYDYHIGISSGVFIVSGLIALLITIITISYHALKTAVSNPVKMLRTE